MSPFGLGAPWVGNELRQVHRAGVPFVLHSLRKTKVPQHFTSPWFRQLHEDTRALYPLSPLGFLLSLLLAPFLFGGRFFRCLWNALTSPRKSLRARVACLWHLLVAAHWARGLRGEDVTLVHSQWIHASGTVAWYGARLLGVPFSFTGHATDLFRDSVALRDKVRDATFMVCISRFHHDYFRKLEVPEERLLMAYCGIDVSHFAVHLRSRVPGEPVRLLSSGRLVEKKGFEYLIDACAELRRRGREVVCTIGGSGPLEASLRARIASHGLDPFVTLTGKPLTQEELPSFMEPGDIYCLPCVWAHDDDVDGLPQMLMEAMACGLPAVSTRLVGIPDLIVHEEGGLLVEPREVGQLADAVERLMDDEDLARRLAAGGRRLIEERFDIETSLDGLTCRYRQMLGMPPAAPADAETGTRSASAQAAGEGASR